MSFHIYYEIKFIQEEESFAEIQKYCSNFFCSVNDLNNKLKKLSNNGNSEAQWVLYSKYSQGNKFFSKDEAEKALLSCAEKEMKCLKVFLNNNYNKKDVSVNKFFLKYYSFLKNEKQLLFFVDFSLFPYSEYLKNNQIPLKEQPQCIVFKKCEEICFNLLCNMKK